jgi:hypothetical protein
LGFAFAGFVHAHTLPLHRKSGKLVELKSSGLPPGQNQVLDGPAGGSKVHNSSSLLNPVDLQRWFMQWNPVRGMGARESRLGLLTTSRVNQSIDDEGSGSSHSLAPIPLTKRDAGRLPHEPPT